MAGHSPPNASPEMPGPLSQLPHAGWHQPRSLRPGTIDLGPGSTHHYASTCPRSHPRLQSPLHLQATRSSTHLGPLSKSPRIQHHSSAGRHWLWDTLQPAAAVLRSQPHSPAADTRSRNAGPRAAHPGIAPRQPRHGPALSLGPPGPVAILLVTSPQWPAASTQDKA